MPDREPVVDNVSVCAAVQDILSATESAARTLPAKVAA